MKSIQELIQLQTSKIELALITRIEEIEGRVPSDQEVKCHSMKYIYPDGKEIYKWRGIHILTVLPLKYPL